MNQAFLLALSLLVVALAGCADDGGSADDLKDEFKEKDEGTGAGTGGSSSSSTSASSSGETGETGEPEPEMGAMSISFAVASSSGQAPFVANFSLLSKAVNADGTEDEEAIIDWAIFDANENSTSGIDVSGTGPNASVEFTFELVGVYEIAAAVGTDGFESAFATVQINVTLDTEPEQLAQDAAGSFPFATPLGCAQTPVRELDGDVQAFIPLTAGIEGGTYEALADISSGGATNGYDVFFLDAADAVISVDRVATGTPLAGLVPANAVTVVISVCGGAVGIDWSIALLGP